MSNGAAILAPALAGGALASLGTSGLVAAGGVGTVAALGGVISCFVPGFTSHPRLSPGSTKGTCSLRDALVMVVSEERCCNCVVYFYTDRDAAEQDAGRWKITSRIMFDLTDPSAEPAELQRWGPAMPHNTIRAAALLCQQAILVGPCGICLEDVAVTTTMQCCQRDDSSNRICAKCRESAIRLQGRCPFCRTPLTA